MGEGLKQTAKESWEPHGTGGKEMAEHRCHELRCCLLLTDIFHRIGCASLKWVDK